jgi:hypothetical protein
VKRTAEKSLWKSHISVVRFTDSISDRTSTPALKRWAISIQSASRTWKMTFAAKPQRGCPAEDPALILELLLFSHAEVIVAQRLSSLLLIYAVEG